MIGYVLSGGFTDQLCRRADLEYIIKAHTKKGL